MICERCQGKKHVFDKKHGAWVRCECFLKQRAQGRRFQAKISTRYDGETWKNFAATHDTEGLKALLQEVLLLRQGLPSEGWFLIHGRPSRARDLCTALILASACEGGFVAAQVDLQDLIDVEFRRDESEHGQGIYEVNVLVVRVGAEPRHQYNKHVMQKLVRTRWDQRLFTILVAEADPGRLIEFYKNGMVQEALRTRFKRVRVEAK